MGLQVSSLLRGALLLVSFGALAGCASQSHQRYAALNSFGGSSGKFSPKIYGPASPRVIADGEEVPAGGGRYHVGKPYQIAGKTYYPSERPVMQTGTASWYGADFHGRRTANGEIFDRHSLTAAHPTMPLPSYARVTNLVNSRSMIVRVNDRGPYHGGRVMDVSQRVAEALDFHSAGTARVKVEWVGRANLDGDDNHKLMATLRDDGAPAQLEGYESAPVMTAEQQEETIPTPPRKTARTPKAKTIAPDAAPTQVASRDGSRAMQANSQANSDEASSNQAMSYAAAPRAETTIPMMRQEEQAAARPTPLDETAAVTPAVDVEPVSSTR